MKKILFLVFIALAGVCKGQEVDSCALLLDKIIHYQKKDNQEEAYKLLSLAVKVGNRRPKDSRDAYARCLMSFGRMEYNLKKDSVQQVLALGYIEQGVSIAALSRSETIQEKIMLACTFLGDGYINIPNKTSKALNYYTKGLDIRKKLADDNPTDTEEQRNLSVAYNKIADLYKTNDKIKEALEYYDKGLTIRKKLADVNLSDTQAQRDLSFSYNKIANIYTTLSKQNEALDYYNKGLTIRKKLADANPTDTQCQRDLSVSYHKIGNLYKIIEKPNEALDYYSKDLEIRKKLVSANPTDTKIQRDLSALYEQIADLYITLDKPSEALDYYIKGLSILRKIDGSNPTDSQVKRNLSVLHNNIADLYTTLGKQSEALDYYDKGLLIFKKLLDENPTDSQAQRDLLVSYYKTADLYIIFGKQSEALDYYNKGLDIAKKLVDGNPADTKAQRDLSVLYNTIADLYITFGKQNEALSYYLKGLPVFKKIVDKNPVDSQAQRDFSIAYNNIADLYIVLGKQKESLDYYTKSLDIRKKRTDINDSQAQRDLYSSYNNVADLYITFGKLNEALDYYNKGLIICKHLSDTNLKDVQAQGDLYVSYSRIADLYITFGRLNEALEYYDKALKIAEKLVDINNYQTQRYLFVSLQRIAGLYTTFGKLTESLEYYNKGLDIVKNLSNINPNDSEIQRDLFVFYNSIGDLFTIFDKPTKALENYIKGLDITKKIADANPTDALAQRDLSVSYNNVADLYTTSGKLSEALDYYNKALIIRKQLSDANLKNAQAQGDLSAAYNGMADLYTTLNRPSEALDYYNKGLIIRKQLADANLKDMNAQGDLSASYNRIANLYLKTNKTSEASVVLKKALGLLQDKFLQESMGVDENATEYLISDLYTIHTQVFQCAAATMITIPDAYTASLHDKGFLLENNRAIENAVRQSGDTILSNDFEQLKDIRRQITVVYSLPEDKRQTLSVLQTEKEDLERKMNRNTLFRDRNAWWQTTYRDVQKALKPAEAAVEIITFPDVNDTTKTYYAALILTKNSKEPQMVVLPTNGKDMDDKHWKDYDANIRNTGINFEEAQKIYWQPIADALGSQVRTVWFSPDGVYHKISLALLGAKGKRVSDVYDLHIVATTRNIADIQRFSEVKRPSAGVTEKKYAVLFGNPDYHAVIKVDTQAIALNNTILNAMKNRLQTPSIALAIRGDDERGCCQSLPGAEKEVRTIAALLQQNNWQTDTFLLAKATEAELRSTVKPTVLHIATHAGYLTKNKEGYTDGLQAAWLHLAGAQAWVEQSDSVRSANAEGVLIGSEAALLDLQGTELVVLSACETGRGTVRNAEGVYGLQRAFRMAGAKAVLSTLWKVRDDATQFFMTTFYTEWLKDGTTKQAALRKAQLILQNDSRYNAPFFWGAFVLLE
jgi:tetratricopeptide (TPR) repeat protein